jgi:hypothetical protein
MTDMEHLQAQVDALRLVVMSLFAAHPNPDKVAQDAAMRLGVWIDVHTQQSVTDSYLRLMEEEREKMGAVLNNLTEQHRADTALQLREPAKKRRAPR